MVSNTDGLIFEKEEINKYEEVRNICTVFFTVVNKNKMIFFF